MPTRYGIEFSNSMPNAKKMHIIIFNWFHNISYNNCKWDILGMGQRPPRLYFHLIPFQDFSKIQVKIENEWLQQSTQEHTLADRVSVADCKREAGGWGPGVMSSTLIGASHGNVTQEQLYINFGEIYFNYCYTLCICTETRAV